jgi:hypothetical protein
LRQWSAAWSGAYANPSIAGWVESMTSKVIDCM